MPTKKQPSKQQLTYDAVTELKAAVVGIPGTDARGMAGDIQDIKTDVKDIKADQKQTNEVVSKNSQAITHLFALKEKDETSTGKKIGFLSGIGAVIAGVIYGIIRVLTNSG